MTALRNRALRWTGGEERLEEGSVAGKEGLQRQNAQGFRNIQLLVVLVVALFSVDLWDHSSHTIALNNS